MRNMKEIIKILALVAVVMLIMLFFMALEGPETAADTKPEYNKIEETAEPVATEPMEVTEKSSVDNTGMIIIEQGPALALSDEERHVVEQVVMAEARGESLEGQMAVAQTIRDRCITRNQTPIEVCTSPGQYSTIDMPVMERVSDAVMFVFDFGHSIYEFPTTHFYQSEMIEKPDYLEEFTYRGQTGPHKFYG